MLNDEAYSSAINCIRVATVGLYHLDLELPGPA